MTFQPLTELLIIDSVHRAAWLANFGSQTWFDSALASNECKLKGCDCQNEPNGSAHFRGFAAPSLT